MAAAEMQRSVWARLVQRQIQKNTNSHQDVETYRVRCIDSDLLTHNIVNRNGSTIGSSGCVI